MDSVVAEVPGTSAAGDEPHGHGTYIAVYVALMVLLAVTVLAAMVELHWASVLVALGIATVKAVLIGLYFMHLRTATGLVRVVAVVGFLWLGLLMTITLADYFTRSDFESAVAQPRPRVLPLGNPDDPDSIHRSENPPPGAASRGSPHRPRPGAP